jgi:hypothetical protein
LSRRPDFDFFYQPRVYGNLDRHFLDGYSIFSDQFFRSFEDKNAQALLQKLSFIAPQIFISFSALDTRQSFPA